MNKPQYFIVHHSGGTGANPLADTSHHTIDMIRAWHKAKGWRDVGYHYVIHKDGSVHKGRKENDTGAHAYGYNTKSIGICLSGNFDATLPTKGQTNALRALLLDLKTRHDVLDENIIPHRGVAKKTCYGEKLSEDWARNLIIKKETPMKALEGKKTYGFIILAGVLIMKALDLDVSEAEVTELVEAGAVFFALSGAIWGRYVAKNK